MIFKFSTPRRLLIPLTFLIFSFGAGSLFAQQTDVVQYLKQELPNSKVFKDLVENVSSMEETFRLNVKDPSFFFNDALQNKFNAALQTVAPDDPDKLLGVVSSRFNVGMPFVKSLSDLKGDADRFRLAYPQLFKLPQIQFREIIDYAVAEVLKNKAYPFEKEGTLSVQETRAECLAKCESGRNTDRNLCAAAAAAGITGCTAAAVGGIIACAATTIFYPACVAAVLVLQAACEAGFLVAQAQCNRTADVRYDACVKACPPENSLVAPPSNINVTAACQDGHVALQWQTTSVNTYANYTIERSADGINWQTAGSVDAANNLTTTRSYKFSDAGSTVSSNFYRVTARQFNGSKAYSSVVGSPCASDQTMSAWPNPVSGNTVVVNIPSLRTLPAVLTVSNAQGTPVHAEWVNLHLGQNQFKLDFTKFGAGVYTVSVRSGSMVKTSKVLKN